MKSTILAATILAATALPATADVQPAAATARAPETVVIDVVDDRGGKADTASFTLRLAGADRTASIEVDDGRTKLKVATRIGTPQAGRVIVGFDLSRRQRTPSATRHAELHLSSKIAVGKRAEIANIAQPGGGTLRIAVTVQ